MIFSPGDADEEFERKGKRLLADLLETRQQLSEVTSRLKEKTTVVKGQEESEDEEEVYEDPLRPEDLEVKQYLFSALIFQLFGRTKQRNCRLYKSCK